MTGSQPTAGEKRRTYSGPVFFSHGFRPFFFSAALFAALAVPLWMAAFSHGYLIGPDGNAMSWHAHETVFGYVAAVVTGFVLTAIPNWTGRLPVMGIPLASLFLIWLAGRIAICFRVDHNVDDVDRWPGHSVLHDQLDEETGATQTPRSLRYL